MTKAADIRIDLTTVVVAVPDGTPRVLATWSEALGLVGLPSGHFDPDRHRTFELAVREFVRDQTGYEPGYVEQLYTFGDLGRADTLGGESGRPVRAISLGYVGLAPPKVWDETLGEGARWRKWYRFFPWEDWREGKPELIGEHIEPALRGWMKGDAARSERARNAWGLDGLPWIEERVLERYELLYELGLASEAGRPGDGLAPGEAMLADHRRILATAMGRLRGKIKYRPIIFLLMPEQFTLSELQAVAEGVSGVSLHTQNFRRLLAKANMVEGTGEMRQGEKGRPAELFRFRREIMRERLVSGVHIPMQRS